jgi:peptidyl-prolyl cis-trans isomerase D
MLAALRDNVGGWVAKIFIGLLALSFAVWGINDVFTGYRGDALVVVGDEEVSAQEFQTAFIQRVNALSAQLGQQLTTAQARDLNIDRQVLGELIRDAALDSQINRLGLAVTEEAIAQQIAENPAFQNSQGQFDREQFGFMLQQNGLTESTFIALQREAILRRNVAGLIDQSLNVPQTMISAIVQQQNETRSAKYFILEEADAGTVPEPSESEQKTYYGDNKRSFTAPEFRTLTLLRLEPEDVAETIDVTDADVRQLYDQRISDYTTPETREIQQIAFDNVEDARAARERIVAGTDFLEIAKERGMKPIDYNLGDLQRSEITDEKLAEAAFSLPEGEVSEPIESKLSVVLIRVLTIKPQEQKSFESVKEDLKRQLGLERAQEEILNLHDAVEDARAEGATLTEIGQKFDLPIIQVDAIDQSGNGPDGKPLSEIPSSAAVVRMAFESDVGIENDPVDTTAEGFVWVDVTEITPSAIKPIEEVRQEVIDLWKTDKTRELLIAKADELVTQAKAGTSIETLADGLGKTVAETGALKRRDKAEAFGPAAVAALFRTTEGSAGLAQGSEGLSLVIFRLEKVDTPSFDPESAEAKTIDTQLTNGVGRDLFEIYIAGLQDSLGIEINERLWESLQGDEQARY